MRYGFMQRAMWAAFQKSFKEAIHTVLDESDGDGVMRRAKKKYREILNDVDEFDKGSRFLTNILSCAMLSAVLLCTEKRYDVETIRIYYKTAMDNKIMRKAVVSGRNYTEKGRARLKAFAKKSQSITNPYDWKFTVAALIAIVIMTIRLNIKRVWTLWLYRQVLQKLWEGIRIKCHLQKI